MWFSRQVGEVRWRIRGFYRLFLCLTSSARLCQLEERRMAFKSFSISSFSSVFQKTSVLLEKPQEPQHFNSYRSTFPFPSPPPPVLFPRPHISCLFKPFLEHSSWNIFICFNSRNSCLSFWFLFFLKIFFEPLSVQGILLNLISSILQKN